MRPTRNRPLWAFLFCIAAVLVLLADHSTLHASAALPASQASSSSSGDQNNDHAARATALEEIGRKSAERNFASSLRGIKRKAARVNQARIFIPSSWSQLWLMGHWKTATTPAKTYMKAVAPGDIASFAANVSSWTMYTSAGVIFAVTGTSRISAYFSSRKGLVGYARTRPGDDWQIMDLSSITDAYILTGLDPQKSYTVELRFSFIPHNALFQFNGIGLDNVEGSKVLPPPWKARVIEFIGDSITALTLPPIEGSKSPSSLALEACRQLRSICQIIAQPTRGIQTLPDVYGKIGPYSYLPDWNPSNSSTVPKPRLLVINLGINDKNLVLTNPDSFVAKYVDFIAQLRQRYGNDMKIVCIVPFPIKFRGLSMKSVIPAKLFKSIVAKAGNNNTYYIDTAGWITDDTSPKYLSDFVHPTAEGFIYLGGKVTKALKSLKLV